MADRRVGALLAVIAAVTIGVHARSIGDYLVWTDHFELEQAHMRVTSADDLHKLVEPDQLLENNYYRPTQILSHTLDHAIYGDAWAGHHLTSVLLHAAAACLLFLLGRRVLAGTGAPHADGTAAAAAIAWSIHPYRVESVAWLADRCNLLQAFSLGALALGAAALARAAEGRRVSAAWWAAMAACFVVGLGAKEVALVVPALLAITHAACGWRVDRGTVARAYGTLGAIAVAYLIVRIGWLWHPTAFQVRYGLIDRQLTQLPVTADHLLGVVWPWSPSASDVVVVHRSLDGAVIASALALIAIVALAITWWRRTGDRLPLWALAWFACCLGPTANLIQQRHFRGDRYTYLASFAILLVLARVGARLIGPRPRLAVVVTIALLAPLAVATWSRTGTWRAGDRAFFTAEVARAPQWREGLGNLCRDAARRGELDLAVTYGERGWAIDPARFTSTAWQPESFYALLQELHQERADCAASVRLAREAVDRFPQVHAYREQLLLQKRRCVQR